MKQGSFTDFKVFAILQLSGQNNVVFHFHNKKTESNRSLIYCYILMAFIAFYNIHFSLWDYTIEFMHFNYFGYN